MTVPTACSPSMLLLVSVLVLLEGVLVALVKKCVTEQNVMV